jgi:RimJ/RimL family protein N-acetyltransferase
MKKPSLRVRTAVEGGARQRRPRRQRVVDRPIDAPKRTIQWGNTVIVTLPRLSLHLYTEEDAVRVLDGRPRPGESWARDYPMFDEVDFLRALVLDRRAGKDPGPFGLYQVRLRENGLVIGGAAFFGPPDEFGAVEIVGNIVPDHTGSGFAGEVVTGMVDIARDNGARFVIASVDVANVAAQKVLVAGGLGEVVRDETIVHFALEFAA